MIQNDEVYSLFPNKRKLRIVPNLEKPKLIFEDKGFRSRWDASSLLPATRLRAQLVRTTKRILTSGGLLGKVINSDRGKSLLDEYLGDRWSPYDAEVLLGTPGPAQKASIRIRNCSTREPVGFIKFGSSVIAKERLENEKKVLSDLPSGLAPKVIKFGHLGNGLALMVDPISGKQPKASVPPDEGVFSYLHSLEKEERQLLVENALFIELEKYSAYAEMARCLGHKKWPVVYMHGDFAPWNMRKSDSSFRTFDWEFGSTTGIPFYDLAFYVLQVGALIYDWSPERAKAECCRTLKLYSPDLSESEASAFASFAAMRSHADSEADGHPSDFFIQPWRKKVWEA